MAAAAQVVQRAVRAGGWVDGVFAAHDSVADEVSGLDDEVVAADGRAAFGADRDGWLGGLAGVEAVEAVHAVASDEDVEPGVAGNRWGRSQRAT